MIHNRRKKFISNLNLNRSKSYCHESKNENCYYVNRKFRTLLLTSNYSLKLWITIFLIFIKLDYEDYFCYGSGSDGALQLVNSENGELNFIFNIFGGKPTR